MKNLYLFLFCFSCSLCFGQVEGPPSLLIGLAGLTGEKGNIDVALLAEIITDKQAELKKEFIKREFYDKLQSRNYVVWEYAYNSLEVLLNSKNKQAIEKEMLEYAANMALIYSFTETYLQVSDRLCNSDLEAVAMAWDNSSAAFGEYFKCGSDKNLKDKLWLSTLKGSSNAELNAILIDLVFDIMRSNKTLKELGFFQSQLPLGEDFYKTHNQYLLTTGPLRVSLDKLRSRMELEMMALINYYYVIKMAVEKGISLNDFAKKVDTKSAVTDLDLENLFADLGKISEVINKSTKPGDADLSPRLSKALGAFIDFNDRSVKNEYRVDDLYYLEEITFPLIVKLVTEYGLNPKYLTLVEKYRSVILKSLLGEMTALLGKTYARDPNKSASDPQIVKELNAVDYREFVEILQQIFPLDRAGTYEDYLKTLRNVSEIFDDTNVSRLIFNLTDYLEKYTILDKEHNAISVDVEEIIIQLMNKYEARLQNNRVNFYFSIGLHQTMGINYKKGFELESDSAVTLRNLAFASEKIGIKVKLKDWRRIRSFDYGETYNETTGAKIKSYNTRKPLVNDVYWLLYGSGLMYNIVNTTTGKNFTYPILGTGIGVAFYNALDFNIFFCSPMVSSESLGRSLARRQMIGFSFDIKVGEYITALRKKRAGRKVAQE